MKIELKKTRSKTISYDKYQDLRTAFDWKLIHAERFSSEVEYVKGTKRYILRDVCGTRPRLTIEYRSITL
jgi:hypothetical protein|tara:strand:+ start:10200 stop:10409 length:210 start_codon:yes stop_codon:yes gene_type:complete